jgi:hypothetical protein
MSGPRAAVAVIPRGVRGSARPVENALNAGLCDHCLHARRVGSARGSMFTLCLLHERDPRFAKYPRLPVVTCSGYEKAPPDPAQ